MHPQSELLDFAKHAVKSAATEFFSYDKIYLSQITDKQLSGRETKLVADKVLEDALQRRFIPSGLTLFTEETGIISQGAGIDGLSWVIDPLDGTINYLRGTGPSMISVGLCIKGIPVFGVLYDLATKHMSWGGKNLGAWTEGQPIRVSAEKQISSSLICTGIPARFRTDTASGTNAYFSKILKFAKVRMIGSAASSLLLVANGAADAYFEDQIMFWDVAAGLAIVQGGGGQYDIQQPNFQAPCKVIATNGLINLES